MLEIVFSDSAAGALSVAQGGGRYIGGASSVLVPGEGEPSQEDRERLLRRFEERERRGWEQAVPLAGRRKDILRFALALNVGPIDEDGIGPQRETSLRLLMRVFPQEEDEVVRELLDGARQSLAALLQRAAKEPIRVWTSDQPDEACGLCWLLFQLRQLHASCDVVCVRLPRWSLREDGTTVLWNGWGEVPPYLWGRLAQSAEPLPASLQQGLAAQWEQLREENAPLRAVVSGSLVSVPETFYDSFLLRELAQEEEVFEEARVIGRVLGKYRLGLSDGWAACRLEEWVRQGLLEPVTQPQPGGPAYHRLLRRRGL